MKLVRGGHSPIIDTLEEYPRFPICCFISKPEHVKNDFGRKTRQASGLFHAPPLHNNYGRDGREVWVKWTS